MSANKIETTKILEDETMDSGFLSGPLSEQNLTEEYNTDEEGNEKRNTSKGDQSKDKQEKRKTKEDSKKDNKSSIDLLSEDVEFDTGIVSMELKSEASCSPYVPVQPLIVIGEDKSSIPVQLQKYDLPPINILFEQDEDGDT